MALENVFHCGGRILGMLLIMYLSFIKEIKIKRTKIKKKERKKKRKEKKRKEKKRNKIK